MAGTEDTLAINNLMNGWIHRDLGHWDELRERFHPDAVIKIAWFEGLASDFIDASARMSRESNLKSKHVITAPLILFNGARAVVETNVLLVSQNATLRLGALGHSRFYDRVELRDDTWRIVHRQSIYDMAGFTYPAGFVDIDAEVVSRHPLEYAPIAYMLEKSGFPIKSVFATKDSEAERAARTAAETWLAQPHGGARN
jgi:hypothetical protein